MKLIDLSDIEDARKRIRKWIHKTPIVHSRTLSELSGLNQYLKLENFQRTGSFKVRGALNKILSISDLEIPTGIITASAGNHGQAMAYAGKIRQIPATVVVPEGAVRSKIEAIKGLGATVIEYGKVWDDAYKKCLEIAEDKGLMIIHPFNDPKIIAGQGTISLEILEEHPDIDAIVAGIGGGGLLAGIAFTATAIRDEIKIFGVEAAGGPAMLKSLEKGFPIELECIDTQADGLASRTVGDNTFKLVKQYVERVVIVNDHEMINAIGLLLERCKILSELAGAASVAAVLSRKLSLKNNSKVVCIISGGNIDLTQLSKFIQAR